MPFAKISTIKKNYKFRTKDNAYGFELLEYGQRPRNTFRLGN